VRIFELASVFLVKTRDSLHENCAKCREFVCSILLQFECKAGIVLVVQQNWFRGLVNELHVVVIVSQVPENVCKQLRKTVINTYLFALFLAQYKVTTSLLPFS